MTPSPRDALTREFGRSCTSICGLRPLRRLSKDSTETWPDFCQLTETTTASPRSTESTTRPTTSSPDEDNFFTQQFLTGRRRLIPWLTFYPYLRQMLLSEEL